MGLFCTLIRSDGERQHRCNHGRKCHGTYSNSSMRHGSLLQPAGYDWQQPSDARLTVMFRRRGGPDRHGGGAGRLTVPTRSASVRPTRWPHGEIESRIGVGQPAEKTSSAETTSITG
jgi:hypothetical protein